MRVGAPTGVVTFLFTDVEGSTRRWEADALSMRVALSAHDAVLRDAVNEHGGWLFKHTGDGVCAAFASPRSAVDAAVAAQRALELPVRMGVATGEAERRGNDYFGAVLNRAARVMAAGHGGQILLADSTAALVPGVELADLGPRRLRDLPTAVGIFAVQAPGLKVNFPPLRTLDGTTGNLRPPATGLIGRESDVPAVAEALRAHRLVTLTGVGGVGKTRLALEVAARRAAEFADGVWVFELASVEDGAAVPDAVAAVLGVTRQPGKSTTASIAGALDGRARLLVFDNCEHVLDAVADLVRAIFRRSTTVTVLATSREGLGIAEEQQWPVPSLDVARGAESAAVALFVDRASSVAYGFSPSSPAEVEAIVEICRRLDGIPLAIELAASRMSSMTAADIRDRLDQRFRLLVGSRRSIERHQTLRHAVAWSFDLLNDAEQSLLERCSVFVGGFDLAGAQAVADARRPDDYAVLDLLDALVRKSLLTVDRSSGRVRFAMLETIREYAGEHLFAMGAAPDARTAHARYLAGREADLRLWWDGPRQRDAYTWFTVELANLRSAFRWSADQGDLDSAATIATCAAFLGNSISNFEPLAWAEELVTPARVADHPRYAMLSVLASQCWATERFADAIRLCDEAEHAIKALHADELPFGIDGLLGAAYVIGGRAEDAVECYQTHLHRSRDRNGLIRTGLVMALLAAGRTDEARAEGQSLMEIGERTGNQYAHSFAALAYGYAFSETDVPAALHALRRGMAIAHDSGNRTTECHIVANLARLETEHGDPRAAFDHLAIVIGNYYACGNTTNMRNPLAILATLLDRLGRHRPAATIIGFADEAYVSATYHEVTTVAAHLRDVLGVAEYNALADAGRAMGDVAVVGYALDQIDEARAAL